MKTLEIPTQEQVSAILNSDNSVDKVWRIEWQNGQTTTVIGETIQNALENSGYRPDTMKLIKDWIEIK